MDVKHKLSIVLTVLSGTKKTASLRLSKVLCNDETATSEDQYDGVCLSKTETDIQVINEYLFCIFLCSSHLSNNAASKKCRFQ